MTQDSLYEHAVLYEKQHESPSLVGLPRGRWMGSLILSTHVGEALTPLENATVICRWPRSLAGRLRTSEEYARVAGLETDWFALRSVIGPGSVMIRITVVSIGLIMALAACGAPEGSADATDGQPSATVEQASADAAIEQRALSKLQERYRFDGPTKTILSRPLTSSEANDVLCVRNCSSRSYYVLILEGEFLSAIRPEGVSTFVPNPRYRFLGGIFDPLSGSAVELHASSSRRDMRAWFPFADVD